MRQALAPLLLLVALGVLVAQQHGLIIGADAPPRPWPAGPTRAVELGVTSGALARNAWRPWRPGDLIGVNRFEQAVRAHASVVMWYADWRAEVTPTQLAAVTHRGSIPEITWEPWNSRVALHAPQPAYRLRNIIDGRFDPYIRRWAQRLAAFGRPVRLRFAQEMNGNWYPWSEGANGNHRGEFVRAWRHVRDIFTAAGAGNVSWVWSPVSGAPPELFPGRRYVDRLGVTCFNGGTFAFQQGWRSFAAICGKSIAQLAALAPGLPIEIPELASAGAPAPKTAWITGMFDFLRAHPEVRSIIWFDVAKETDWRLETVPAAARAFSAGLKALGSRA